MYIVMKGTGTYVAVISRCVCSGDRYGVCSSGWYRGLRSSDRWGNVELIGTGVCSSNR